MSSGTSTSSINGTVLVSGPDVIQIQDFFVSAGILHPITVGSTAVIVLFAYLRIGSNRSITPITVFDWVVDVALGSTLAGIVNGNSLVSGLLALATMLGFQYFTSAICSRFERLAWLFQGPPMVLAFRGKMLKAVMKKHRISSANVNAALRQNRVLNVSEVECAIIEPNGSISVFTVYDLKEAGVKPDVLLVVPAYKALCKQQEESEQVQGEDANERDVEKEGRRGKDEASPDQDSTVIETC